MKSWHMAWLTVALLAGWWCVGYSTRQQLELAASAGKWEEIDAALRQEPDNDQWLPAAELALEAGEDVKAFEWVRTCIRLAAEEPERAAEWQRAKALAEFILRNSPKQIEITLQLARNLEQESEPGALLEGVAGLLGRAEEWKKRNYAEWPELVTSLMRALDAFRDNGDAGLMVRHTLLYVNGLNLQTGDYAAGAEKLQQIVTLYYPDALRLVTYRRELPNDACRLLTQLSRQYADMARRSNLPEEKKRCYAQAAGYLLNCANALSEESDEFARASAQLLEYQEALRLLGYQLRLPESIVPTAATGRRMLEEMLEQRRYRAAVTAIQAELTKEAAPEWQAELLVLYLQALTGAEDYAAIATAGEPLRAELLSAAGLTRLFQCARELRTRQMLPEALVLFSKGIDSGHSDHPDYSGALFQAAQLALDRDQPGLAARYFQRYGATLPASGLRTQAMFHAALCFYRAGEFAEVRAVAQAQEPTIAREEHIRFTLLGAQAALQLDESITAQRELEALLTGEIPPEQQAQVRFLVAAAALRHQDWESARRHLEFYLDRFPDEPEALPCAERLLELYRSAPEETSLAALAERLARHHATRSGTLPLLEAIARIRLETWQSTAALDGFRALAATVQWPDELRLQAIRTVNQEVFATLKTQQAQTVDELTATGLPPLDDNAVVRELYCCRLNAKLALQQYEAALALADQLLACAGQYRFFDVKLCRGAALCGLAQYEAGRREYQEALAIGATAANARQVGLLLAEAWRAEGNFARAIVAAWHVVPTSRPAQWTGDERREASRALQLIVECSKRISSTIDQQEAEVLLQQINGNG